MDDLRRFRLQNTKRMMKEQNLDALIVCSYDSTRYITDCRPIMPFDCYTEWNWTVLPIDGDPVLISQYADESSGKYWFGQGLTGKFVRAFHFTPAAVNANRWADTLVRILREAKVGAGNIGVEYLDIAVYEALKKKLPNATFVPALEKILTMRATKNNIEQELLREAARIEDVGMQTMFDSVEPGLTENQIYLKVVNAMIQAGSQAIPYQTACSSGKNLLTTVFPTNKKIREGDVFWIDIGCIVEGGYMGDVNRCSVAGKASREVKAMYTALYEAYMEGAKLLKPGTKASDIDVKIRTHIREAGYPDNFNAGTGHGVGLRLLEFPWIVRPEEALDKDTILKPGMIVCIEPATFLKDVTAVYLEDMFLITETGYEFLTKSPREPDAVM